jgi:mannose-1-phosphate guanylyltransferase/mannose-6-phosphate isomerase
LQETAERACACLNGQARDITIVTQAAHGQEVQRHLAAVPTDAAHHILLEPSARGTAAAIALAALYAQTAFGADSLLWIMPTDHLIGDQQALEQALQKGEEAARQNHIVLFGITPTQADTGYGYIERGQALDGLHDAFHIAGFAEKPASDIAESFIRSGRYLWNSGMSLCKSDVLLAQFRSHAPAILAAVEKAAAQQGYASPDRVLYDAIPAMAFDRAVMERTENGVVIPFEAAWSDIGSWDRLWQARPKDKGGNACSGPCALEGAENCLIESHGGRIIACAGVRDLVIVDTGHTVLVADRRDEASLAALRARLAQGKTDKNRH